MIRHWVERGTNGFRLFTGGSMAAFDPSTLDDPRSFPSCSPLGPPRRDLSAAHVAHFRRCAEELPLNQPSNVTFLPAAEQAK